MSRNINDKPTLLAPDDSIKLTQLYEHVRLATKDLPGGPQILPRVVLAVIDYFRGDIEKLCRPSAENSLESQLNHRIDFDALAEFVSQKSVIDAIREVFFRIRLLPMHNGTDWHLYLLTVSDEFGKGVMNGVGPKARSEIIAYLAERYPNVVLKA